MLPLAALPPLRLLIADREVASGEALAGTLRKVQHFEFVGIVPPERALQQAALRRVNIVLLDVLKPHDASAALCQGLCALAPRPIVIALTTFGDAEEERALRRAGANEYLLKEVASQKLAETIHQIFTRAHEVRVH
jgi:DNA-binding NarL/FixJ family response regulator